MKQILMITLMLTLISIPVLSQSRIPAYHQQADFLLTSPGSFGNGMLGYVNPANLGYLPGFEMRYLRATDDGKWTDHDRWSFLAAAPGFGFGVIRTPLVMDNQSVKRVTDYRIGFGGGNDGFNFGLGYGWSSGDLNDIQRDRIFYLGGLARPNNYLSIGLSGSYGAKHGDWEAILDLGVRPLGTDFLTVFGDYAIQNEKKFDEATWSVGAAAQVLPGIFLTGRYFDSKAFTAGISFSFGNSGVTTHAAYDNSNDLNKVYYGFRTGAKEYSLFNKISAIKPNKYLKMGFKGSMTYQRYRFFDKGLTLKGTLETIQKAIDDPAVEGIVLNLYGMQISSEMVWEVREKLKQFKLAGKKLVVYLDNGEMGQYHLASVADKIIFDPDGTLILKGYVMGRTYQKGTLEKLGLGFDEWRFFKYKSAVEDYARESMSDADRVQRQALIDNQYALVKKDICESRKISPEEFDNIINNKVVFLAEEAVKAGLVDTVGRWIDIEEILKKETGKKKGMIGAGQLAGNELPRRDWEPQPKIALVYGLGPCAMEEGINGVKLEKIFTALTNDHSIKAVVFRVDSPGGAVMPSDMVANAMKKCAEKKPVIVSQGAVAASGGYWISMNADTIVAAPNTITGSIGVIGGWIWNKNFGEKLGLTSDYVKVGDHADFTFGITLPLVGLQIPNRNLTPEERAKMEAQIRTMYAKFKAKVAKGRGMKEEAVEEIAQGRVWTGTEGKEKGLVDEIGGLETALFLAKKAAKIADDKDVKIIEYPEAEAFNPEVFMPKLLGIKSKILKPDQELEFLKIIAKNPGLPVVVLSPDFYLNEK